MNKTKIKKTQNKLNQDHMQLKLKITTITLWIMLHV